MNISKVRLVDAISGLLEEFQHHENDGKDLAVKLADFDEQGPMWPDFFKVMDDELDHGIESNHSEDGLNVIYVGSTGVKYWLLTREYIAVFETAAGTVFLNYSPGAMQGVKLRSVKFILNNTVYIIKENSPDLFVIVPEMLGLINKENGKK